MGRQKGERHWYHNPDTGKEILLRFGEPIPEGFIKGRHLNPNPNFPFTGCHLSPERLAENRKIMKPYYEHWLREHKYGKYRETTEDSGSE